MMKSKKKSAVGLQIKEFLNYVLNSLVKQPYSLASLLFFFKNKENMACMRCLEFITQNDISFFVKNLPENAKELIYLIEAEEIEHRIGSTTKSHTAEEESDQSFVQEI